MSFMLYNKKNNSNKTNKPRTKLKTKQKKNQNIYESEKVDKVYMSFSLTTLLQTDAKQFCSCLKAFNFIHSYDTVRKKNKQHLSLISSHVVFNSFGIILH